MDVAAWLRDLGLERYVSAFRDNDIDAEVLPKLTAEDLISIGVTSVGHRRKLLDAIAGLGTAVPTAVVAAPAPGAPAVDAERRQLTVMFCDVVGSTALLAGVLLHEPLASFCASNSLCSARSQCGVCSARQKNSSEVTWFTPGRTLHAYVCRHARAHAHVIG